MARLFSRKHLKWYLHAIHLLAIVLLFSITPTKTLKVNLEEVNSETEIKFTKGKDLYNLHCSSCHGQEFEGSGIAIPPISLSYLNNDKQKFTNIILSGLDGSIVVNGKEYNGVMPAIKLDSNEINEIYEYVSSECDY